MRKLLAVALALIATCAVVVFLPHTVAPPAGGGWRSLTDPVCDAVRSARPADVVLDAQTPLPTARPPIVPFSELPFHDGEFVRFDGYLFLTFEGTTIFASFEDGLLDLSEWFSHGPVTAPRGLPVDGLGGVFHDDSAWFYRNPLLGSRCARIESRFTRQHQSPENPCVGIFTDVRRLEIWREPYRPLVPEHRLPYVLPPVPPRIRSQLR